MKVNQSPSGLAVLLMAAACFALTPALRAQVQPIAQQVAEQSKAQPQVKTYLGTIMRLKTGQYALVTSQTSSGQFSGHLLDDQVEAKQYAGKKVLVTGVLNATSNIIHVIKIVAA